jgi:hypothetical protein
MSMHGQEVHEDLHDGRRPAAPIRSHDDLEIGASLTRRSYLEQVAADPVFPAVPRASPEAANSAGPFSSRGHASHQSSRYMISRNGCLIFRAYS